MGEGPVWGGANRRSYRVNRAKDRLLPGTVGNRWLPQGSDEAAWTQRDGARCEQEWVAKCPLTTKELSWRFSQKLSLSPTRLAVGLGWKESPSARRRFTPNAGSPAPIKDLAHFYFGFRLAPFTHECKGKQAHTGENSQKTEPVSATVVARSRSRAGCAPKAAVVARLVVAIDVAEPWAGSGGKLHVTQPGLDKHI